MRILYISCHQVLEYDEVRLFSELGYDIFSAGTYACPWFRDGMIRPGIPTLTHYPELERLASTIVSSGYNIPQELIDWADTIIFMHMPEALEKNLAKFTGKRVIFRSIGQNVGHTENLMRLFRDHGVQIVRYSPNERFLPGYAGGDVMIRFYKDPNHFFNWYGEFERVINFTQSMTQRGQFVQKAEIMRATAGLHRLFYGVGNEDLASEWGGQPEYSQMLGILARNRAYIYGGTWPAPYTLSFIEAFMAGIPVVATGRASWDKIGHFPMVYEIPELINNGIDGFVSDNPKDIHNFIGELFTNFDFALQISRAARVKATEVFGIKTIAAQWREFLDGHHQTITGA